MVNLRQGLWVATGAVLLVFGILGGLTFFKKEAPTTKVKGIRDFVQSRGEEALRKKTAVTFVAVYEKMLAQYPDNLELKKKLAAAYTEAGQPEKAGPLLEEIAKSEQKTR